MVENQNMDLEISLLHSFNRRDKSALGEIYKLYSAELVYFAKQLYRGTNIEARDVVHDLIIKIWESKEIQFNKLDNIKGYMYVSMKNGFLNYIVHNKRVDRFNKALITNPDNFVSQMIVSETLASLSDIAEFIPSETAEIFRLMIEGWSIKEIADEMNLSPSSIYTKRSEAIKIIKEKMPKKSIVIILIISNL